MSRLAIVNSDRCKPKKCHQECKKSCPVVKMGKLCIEVDTKSTISYISENLCIGCGICVKKCPFKAISIINLPKSLEAHIVHKYGPNSFQLHRLPVLRKGKVLGLVGANGTGKTTALKILSGKMIPNMGPRDTSSWSEVSSHFKGSELQNYFKRVSEGHLKVLIKPQHIEQISKLYDGKISILWNSKVGSSADEKRLKKCQDILETLELGPIMDRRLVELSGGEKQRFFIGLMAIQKADVYMFDEPSSFLDIRQRIYASNVIRDLSKDGEYVVVVEHDLSILDYLSDYICCLYGVPGAYGIITLPYGVHEGINVFLAGFIPTENLRFRDYDLNFKLKDVRDEVKQIPATSYSSMEILLKSKTSESTFQLNVQPGKLCTSEITVLLGQNGMGKTSFIRMMAGTIIPSKGAHPPAMNISYKPQTINVNFEGTVLELMLTKIKTAYHSAQFRSDVVIPLGITHLEDFGVSNLSGGERQRVAIALALGKPADVYLLDEPSAYLDSEQRVIASKVIKKFIMHSRKTALVVEHDFIMATYLADKVIVFEGIPSINAVAQSPMSLLDGMNLFLKQLETTFRRDPDNYRPRINKLYSVKDMEQKRSGNYFTYEE